VASCVIRRVDKFNRDPLLDVGCTKAGDFIEIQDDGFFFGTNIVNSDMYIILELPNILAADIVYLLKAENIVASNIYIRKRGQALNMLKLPPRASSLWDGNKVSRPWELAVLKANLVTKIPLNEPNVI